MHVKQVKFIELYLVVKSDEEVKEIMSFYDYVEIQPIENNAYLIEKGKC